MTNIDEESLKREMSKYKESMKIFLPIEEQINKLRRSGMSLEEMKNALGNNKNILEYVPNTLYHGSPEKLDIINSKESTQRGSYVYATDNPVHALFFSIFRNSSIARSHINEYIDENGNYKVKYEIDERIEGALDEIIVDKEITIHICDGNQFFKPQGAAYIRREWCSKEGKSIIPIGKIHVNVKQFFENLEKEGLVEYSRYNKTKDWQTVIDLLGQNYPFGLGTDRGKNIEEFDSMYDDFIGTNFPEQLKFSKVFRSFIKETMTKDFKLDNPYMSLKEENDYKLRYIKSTADSLLIAKKDEFGKISWSIDVDKLNALLNPVVLNEEEKERKL